jgi:hypothetical protein
MMQRSRLVGLKLLFGISLLGAAPVWAAGQQASAAQTCEVHVWAVSNSDDLRPADPAHLTPVNKSWVVSVLDASQRLQEMDADLIRTELGMPNDTIVVLHRDAMISRKRAEDKSSRIGSSQSSCYFDWALRGEGYHGPSPEGFNGIFADHKNGRMYFKSYFRQMSISGKLVKQVNGSHSAPLPVISGPNDKKDYIYDTAAGTRSLIKNAAQKILKNFDLTQKEGSVS